MAVRRTLWVIHPDGRLGLDGLVAVHVVEYGKGPRTFVIVAIVGTECTGKTTLCNSLAQHYDAEWLPEYAREYFSIHAEKRRHYTVQDIASIATTQICRERNFVSDRNSLRILDTDAVVLYVWWLDKFGRPPIWLVEHLQGIEGRHYLLMKPDVPWEIDALRESQHDRERIHNLYTRALEEFESPYTEIEGLGASRLSRAIEVIATLT